MSDFFANHKDELYFTKMGGYDILNHNNVPKWYSEGSILDILLYRNKEKVHMEEFREFASSMNCVCLGDFGLALLWKIGGNKLPQLSFIISPYESSSIQETTNASALINSSEGWKFHYDDEPSDARATISADSFFICFRKV
jgi:hypothetical protein